MVGLDPSQAKGFGCHGLEAISVRHSVRLRHALPWTAGHSQIHGDEGLLAFQRFISTQNLFTQLLLCYKKARIMLSIAATMKCGLLLDLFRTLHRPPKGKAHKVMPLRI